MPVTRQSAAANVEKTTDAGSPPSEPVAPPARRSKVSARIRTTSAKPPKAKEKGDRNQASQRAGADPRSQSIPAEPPIDPPAHSGDELDGPIGGVPRAPKAKSTIQVSEPCFLLYLLRCSRIFTY